MQLVNHIWFMYTVWALDFPEIFGIKQGQKILEFGGLSNRNGEHGICLHDSVYSTKL